MRVLAFISFTFCLLNLYSQDIQETISYIKTNPIVYNFEAEDRIEYEQIPFKLPQFFEEQSMMIKVYQYNDCFRVVLPDDGGKLELILRKNDSLLYGVIIPSISRDVQELYSNVFIVKDEYSILVSCIDMQVFQNLNFLGEMTFQNAFLERFNSSSTEFVLYSNSNMMPEYRISSYMGNVYNKSRLEYDVNNSVLKEYIESVRDYPHKQNKLGEYCYQQSYLTKITFSELFNFSQFCSYPIGNRNEFFVKNVDDRVFYFVDDK